MISTICRNGQVKGEAGFPNGAFIFEASFRDKKLAMHELSLMGKQQPMDIYSVSDKARREHKE